MANKRIGKHNYYLNIAQEVSRRGTCLRRNFGAVIVNKDQIIATGYTGSPRGSKNCVDIGYCPREEFNIPAGERYELCRSVHAEMNAIIHASRRETIGGILYLVGLDAGSEELLESVEPCRLCKRVIINAGIEEVISINRAKQIKSFKVAGWAVNEDLEYHVFSQAPATKKKASAKKRK